MKQEEWKVCKGCGIDYPNTRDYYQRRGVDKTGSKCIECYKAYHKAYNKKPETIARQKAYREEPESKKRDNKYTQDYQKIPEVKVKRIKFRQIDEVKAKQKAYTKEYNSRPEVKAKIKAYSSSPEVKARAKARREQPEEKARLKELSLIRREKKKLSKPLPENKVRQDTELVMQQLNRGFISSTRRKKVVEIEGKPSHAEKRTFLTYEEEEEIQRPYRIIREKKKLERAEKRRLKALAEGTTEKNRAI